MVNGLTPLYRSDLVHVPANVNNSSNYNLCYSIHLFSQCTYFSVQSLLLPSAAYDWNNTPDQHSNVKYRMTFKNVFSRDQPVVPKHFLFGSPKRTNPSHTPKK